MQTSNPVGESSTDETPQTSGTAQNTTNAAAANEPIIITGGSIEIDLDKTIFPPDTGNPNRNKNANKKLRWLTIAKKTSPNSPLMSLDLQSVDNGKCIITVEYD